MPQIMAKQTTSVRIWEVTVQTKAKSSCLYPSTMKAIWLFMCAILERRRLGGTALDYFKPIISALMNALIDEVGIPGCGGEHECFTADDSIRFESVSRGGAINATHIVIREVNGGITTSEHTYTSPSIVYKVTTFDTVVLKIQSSIGSGIGEQSLVV
ncbi:hypothetical protein TSMEX_004242 [Taenia solium]|eukprot:TsM_001209700 transcript=TsM_001209700 gene=TsM_001209700